MQDFRIPGEGGGKDRHDTQGKGNNVNQRERNIDKTAKESSQEGKEGRSILRNADGHWWETGRKPKRKTMEGTPNRKCQKDIRAVGGR